MTTSQPQLDAALSRQLSALNLLAEEDAKRAGALANSEQISLDRAVLKLGLVDEDDLLPLLAEALDLPSASDLKNLELDAVRLQKLSVAFCLSHSIAPVQANDDSHFILTNNPTDADLAQELEFHLEDPVQFAIATKHRIRELISRSMSMASDGSEDASDELLRSDQETLRREQADGPIIRFVSDVFNDAVSKGASDIHFEAQEVGLRIRFRLGGVLQTQPVDRRLSVAAIFARIKVMASMNVSERRLPQDGRITTNIAGRKVDFRISSVPTAFGESVVCRVLDPRALRLGWDKLGFDEAITREIISIIEQPSGLFLVTGPTGSGKTTTLYTALSHLNQDERKILTVEDPVEYNLAGIEQVQVHDEIGMTFARALRTFLRQDPNIIMVGEIRDQETAEIACRAALVGRMVLSTLHTNSPEGAQTRLVDLGVPEYIVKDVLRGVLGQSLAPAGNGKVSLTARLLNCSN